MAAPDIHTKSRIVGINDAIVTLAIEDRKTAPLVKNEVVELLLPVDHSDETRRLKAEVLRIKDNQVDVQVYESTDGLSIGMTAEHSGIPLSISLGPGLLGMVYDGLLNPLEDIATHHQFFLPRGVSFPSLNEKRLWQFEPSVRSGEVLCAGDTLGHVSEGRIKHHIMVPFNWNGHWMVDEIHWGDFHVMDPLATLSKDGESRLVSMQQEFSIRDSIAQSLHEKKLVERLYPQQPLVTSQRIIDTFFPVGLGGTACIPGPFGAGKTVLQHLIAKHASVDIVIIVACGERAGEVVEVINEFPELIDPQTGESLMQRTIIICNTSSMPVAAREASIYTGITLGEYYRQMGLNVLILADSTSRWAQAMRETSGRLEEIPGEEAFPAYLDSAIRSMYERAGLYRLNNGEQGSVTLIGTVSPAGGNFEEPVTQSTLRSVKTFLGLSAERAYKRFYPAIDPLSSWSRYHEQLTPWFSTNMHAQWTSIVQSLQELLQKGDEVSRMMQVTGEEGISLEDFVTYLQAMFVDRVYLQQDAFDDVDCRCSMERQKLMMQNVQQVIDKDWEFENKTVARKIFTKLTNLFHNQNFEHLQEPGYVRLQVEIDQLLA